MQLILNGNGGEVVKLHLLEVVESSKIIWNSSPAEICVFYPDLFISFKHLIISVSIRYLLNIWVIFQFYVIYFSSEIAPAWAVGNSSRLVLVSLYS